MTQTASRPAETSTGTANFGAPLPASGRQRSRRGLDLWAAIGPAATVVVVALNLIPLSGVILGYAWIPTVMVAVVVTMAVVAVLRVLRVRDAIPPWAGLAALLATVTFVYFRDSALFGLIPTPATFAEFTYVLGLTSDTVMTNIIPVEVDAGMLVLLSLAAGLIALLCEALIMTMRMPAVAMLTPVALLVVPALLRPDSIGWSGAFLAALAALIVLAVGQWWSRRRPIDAQWVDGPDAIASEKSTFGTSGPVETDTGWKSTAAVAGAVLLVVGVVTALLPGFSEGQFPHGSRLQLTGPNDRVSPLIRLGDDLRQPESGSGQVTYQTTAAGPMYLRMSTITDLSDNQWGPDTDNSTFWAIDRFGRLNAPMDEIVDPTDEVQVRVSGYSMPWLPVPSQTTYFTASSGDWQANRQTGDIRGALGQSYGDVEYLAQVLRPEITRERLIDAPNTVPAAMVEELELPEAVPDVVRETSEQLAAISTNHFERALAIQQYLRGPGFGYSLDAPSRLGYDGTGMRVVGEFLERKEGYCVHYAAAMAVLAREMGIPSRIVVGLAPGRSVDNPFDESDDITGGDPWKRTYSFSSDSRDAHAWPELYFSGVGWVPFEPTPGRGVLPNYTINPTSAGEDNGSENPLSPDNAPNAAEQPDAAEQPQDAAPDEAEEAADAAGPGASGSESGGPSPLWVMGTLAIVLLLLFAPAFIRWVQRRRRLGLVGREDPPDAGGSVGSGGSAVSPGAGGSAAAEAAWEEVEATAQDVGLPRRPAESARAFAERLAVESDMGSATARESDGSLRQSDGMGWNDPEPHDPRAALGRLTDGLEQARYSGGSLLTAVSANDVVTVRRALFATADPRTRLMAFMFPRSLLQPGPR